MKTVLDVYKSKHTLTYTHTHSDHHSLVSHNSTPHHGILHINWCCLVAIFTPLQPLRQTHYSLISRTWPFIKSGHVKQSHRALFTDSGGLFFFLFFFFCTWMAAAKCDCIRCIYLFVSVLEFMWESMCELPCSSFLSKGLPLLHVRSAQRAGRTQHRTKDNSHQEQRQIKDRLQRHQMERKWERNLLKNSLQ